MTYYVSKVLENGDKTCIEVHSYRDAKKWAKDWGGNVEVICEQMQMTKYGKRPVATRIWQEVFVNGELKEHKDTGTRYHYPEGEVPIKLWETYMEADLELY